MLRIVWHGDTLAALPPQSLRTLNLQLALLADYRRTCDSAVAAASRVIDNYRMNEQDLAALLVNKDLEIETLNQQLGNQKLIAKKTRRKWIKTTLYSSVGAAVVGLLAGMLTR